MRVRLVAAALFALVLAGCSAPEQSRDIESGPGQVTELRSVDMLRTAFDKDAGKARLLLILSPT